MRIFGNFMGPGGKTNIRGKAWEERLADGVVSFNPAGLCCREDHYTSVAAVSWHAQRESHECRVAG